MKLWDFQQLADADSGEDSQFFFLEPLEEVALGQGVRVRGLVWQAEGRWLVSDEAGSLIQVPLDMPYTALPCGSPSTQFVAG